MKKNSVVVCMIIATLVAILATGCTGLTTANRLIGSGKPASQDYPLSGFNAVDIDSAFKVSLTRGEAFKVTVTMDDNLLQYASVTKDGNTLRIKIDTRGIPSFSSKISEASITMPDLQGVRLNGASQATMTGFGQVSKFDANLDGASKLSGDLQATDITLKTNGASSFSLKGKGTTLALDADGASRGDLGSLAVQKASVTMNGASNATVNASANLDYNINGASTLRYAGSPSIGQARAEGASTAGRQ